jgi:hypothetical protein
LEASSPVEKAIEPPGAGLGLGDGDGLGEGEGLGDGEGDGLGGCDGLAEGDPPGDGLAEAVRCAAKAAIDKLDVPSSMAATRLHRSIGRLGLDRGTPDLPPINALTDQIRTQP